MTEREMFSTPTGVHFDAASVRLGSHEREVLYAVAENELLRRPTAEVAGGANLEEAARRLVRRGFIVASSVRWSDGVLTVSASLTHEGELHLLGAPLHDVRG